MISGVQDEDSSLQDSCPSWNPPGAAGGGAAREGPIHTSLSSWAQRSSGQITWSSHTGSYSSKESGTESPEPNSGSARTLGFKPSERPRSRAQSLTTWATVKKEVDDIDGKNNKTSGLMTWRSLKEESNQEKVEPDEPKSKSLPNLPKSKLGGSNDSIKEEIIDKDSKMESGVPNGDVTLSQLGEILGKKNGNSSFLLEMFQKMRGHDDHEVVPPETVQEMTMGTWSMSDASSVKSGMLSPERKTPDSPAPGPPALKPESARDNSTDKLAKLTSWNTIKNLSHLSRSKSSSTCNDSLMLSRNSSFIGSTSASCSLSSSSSKAKHSDSGDISSSTHSIGVGCGLDVVDGIRDIAPVNVITKTKKKESCDFSSQFPPLVSEMCVQTSFEEPKWSLENQDQCLQTSVEERKSRKQKHFDGPPPPPKPPRQPHLQKACRSADNSPFTRPHSPKEDMKKSDKIHSKWTDCIFSNLSKLPELDFLNRNITEDLAFLNGGMTRSASSSDEFTRGPIFKPISSMNRLSRPISFVTPIQSKKKPHHERKRSSSEDPQMDTRRSTSSSRESSPGVQTRRRTFRKNHEGSSSDYASSSSSGIDPGSFDSQGTRTPQYFSDLALFSPSNSDCTATSSESDTITESLQKARANPSQTKSMDDIKGIKFNMPKVDDEGPTKPKDVRILRLKEEARLCKQMDTAETGGFRKKKSCDSIDGFDKTECLPRLSASYDGCDRCQSKRLSSLSPSNSWTWSPSTSMESSHNNNSDPKTECIHYELCQKQTTCRTVVKCMTDICERCACSSSRECECGLDATPPPPPPRTTSMRKDAWIHHAQCLRTEEKSGPLKPCLVKRRKARRAPMKHRSWSDTRDFQVMRYSQEGQTKYQLIMPPSCGKECPHGLSSKSVAFTSLPADVLLKSIGEQVIAAVGGKIDLDIPLPESFGSQVASASLELDPTKMQSCCKAQAPGVVHHSPEAIPVMPCPCCHTSSGCTSSTCSSSTGECFHVEGRRARKSVSFSEEISYHSPYPSPHTSPKKQVQPIVPPHRSAELQGSNNSSMTEGKFQFVFFFLPV